MAALILPVFNGGKVFAACIEAVNMQSYHFDRKIVMDSGSNDESRVIAVENGFEVYNVPKSAFNHGGTRARAVEMVEDELILFLTQDAILDDHDAAFNLLSAFNDPEIGAAGGRQIPHLDANALARHARLSSYGSQNYFTSLKSDFPVGIRKCNLSNSFAAYRRTALAAVGSFPDDVILGEDMYVAARMLQAGWKVAYVADARARHSHNYSVDDEFRRYFDIGVFHNQQSWILDNFGRPESEGAKTAISQIQYLIKAGEWGVVPLSVAMSGAKLVGYKLGLINSKLGKSVSQRLSMHPNYFNQIDKIIDPSFPK
jgi:rhamnosyltransferase